MEETFGRRQWLGRETGHNTRPQRGGDLTAGDLMCLPRYMAYCRLLVDGMPSKPFSMQTLPPIGRSREDRTAIVRKVSRRRYARPLSQVNSQLERQLAVGG